MRLIYFILFSIALTWGFFNELYDNTGKLNMLAMIVAIVCFGLFVFFLIELIKRKAELTLTRDGFEIRNDGYYHWSMLDSFETRYSKYHRPRREQLIFHFKEFPDKEIDITEWELSKDEIVEQILYFKGKQTASYIGDNGY